MKNYFKKLVLLSMVCGAFAVAEEIPQPLKDLIKSMESPRFYYDTMLTFGDKKIFTPMKHTIVYPSKVYEAVKESIDNNATYQKQLAELRKQDEDFCENFFNDLKEFKNIEVKKPLFKEVPYHDKDFRYAMGDCYYMGLDWYSGDHRFHLPYNLEFSPNTMIKPYSYTLYETNFAGKDNLLLIQNFDYFNKYRRADDTKFSGYSNTVVVNNDMCESVFESLNNPNDFNVFKDRKIVGGEKAYTKLGIYDEYCIDTNDFNNNLNIINYKGQDYIFIIERYEDSNKFFTTLFESFREKYFDDTADADWLKERKCERRYN